MAFCGYLRQSTATTLLLGPFLDDVDGKTPETALTIAQADVLLWKEGGTTLAQKNDTATATHRSNGLYTAAINTTDTNTAGMLVVSVTETGALPIKQEYQVLPAVVYDQRFSANANALNGIVTYGTAQAATGTTIQLAASELNADDTLIGCIVAAYGSNQSYWQFRVITDYVLATDTATVDTWTVTPTGTITYVVYAAAPGSISVPTASNLVQIAGQTASASGTVTFPNATLASTTNITAGTITTASNVTTVNGLAAGAITATSIASNAITSAKIATDAIGAAQLAADASSEIAASVLTAATSTPIAANTKQINDATVLGNGTSGNKWRG